MKKLTLMLSIFLMTFISCENNIENSKTDISKFDSSTFNRNGYNTEGIFKALDSALEAYVQDVNINNEEISRLFFQVAKDNGVNVINIDTVNKIEFSEDYHLIIEKIANANLYEDEISYLNELFLIKQNINYYSLSEVENELVLDQINFMENFIKWMEQKSKTISESSNMSFSKKCSGWWKCWGKCAASIVGGSIGGGIAGCGAGAAVGAPVGAAIGSAAGGIGAIPGAGVGALQGCAIGGAIGMVGGALVGAAAGC